MPRRISLNDHPQEALRLEQHHSNTSQAQTSVSPSQKPHQAHATGTDPYETLKPIYLNVITVGSAIGTGLMIGTGNALSKAGPAAMVISHTVVGIVVFLILCALGELTTWLPVPAPHTGHAARFCDPALGFALGWTFWLKYTVIIPNQLIAGALVVSFWAKADQINPGIWIAVFWTLIVLINFFFTPYVTKVEFGFAWFKILVVSCVLITSLVLILGGGPTHEVLGFRYWRYPGAFAEGDGGLSAAVFAVWSIMPSATFAYLGAEVLGVNMSHAQRPRSAIPWAIQLAFCRIAIFYILAILLIGMLVPYDSPDLVFAPDPSRSAAASVFVAALQLSGIRVLPDMLNACILMFVLSAANYGLYMATRVIYGLSREGKAPAFLTRISSNGRPTYALGVCALPALSAFAAISGDTRKIFDHYLHLVTMLGLMIWISILITHVSFVRARKAQRISSESLVYRAPFGALGSWVGIALCIVIGLSKAFDTVVKDRSGRRYTASTMLISYVGLPIFLIILISHKIARRSHSIRPEKVDLWSTKAEHLSEEPILEQLPLSEQGKRVWSERLVQSWLL